MKSIIFYGKSIKQIIKGSNYKFNLNINKLIQNSKKTRQSISFDKRKLNKPPRPQNAWIIYRRDKSVMPEFVEKHFKDVSKKILRMWKAESNKTKLLFDALAKLANQIHSKLYINYKYKLSKAKKSKNNINKMNIDFILNNNKLFI